MKYLFLLSLFVSFFSFSHNARLDKDGGHNCSAKSISKGLCEGYHFHNLSSRSAEVGNIEYDRSEWPHWVDFDSDCQDSRSEILIEYSLVDVKFKRNKGCNVSWGKWLTPYTNEIINKASSLDIDHVVPLENAHQSGGYAWSREKRRAFANDPENLLVTSASANRSKGSKSPERWMPPYDGYHCTYLKKWVYIKKKYELSFSKNEFEFIVSKSSLCNIDI